MSLKADKQMSSLPVRLFTTLCVCLSLWHMHTRSHTRIVFWSAEEEEEAALEGGNWDVS